MATHLFCWQYLQIVWAQVRPVAKLSETDGIIESYFEKKINLKKNGSQQKSDMQNYQAGKELNNDLISAYLQVPTRILKMSISALSLLRATFVVCWWPLQTQTVVSWSGSKPFDTLKKKKRKKVLKWQQKHEKLPTMQSVNKISLWEFGTYS